MRPLSVLMSNVGWPPSNGQLRYCLVDFAHGTAGDVSVKDDEVCLLSWLKGSGVLQLVELVGGTASVHAERMAAADALLGVERLVLAVDPEAIDGRLNLVPGVQRIHRPVRATSEWGARVEQALGRVHACVALWADEWCKCLLVHTLRVAHCSCISGMTSNSAKRE